MFSKATKYGIKASIFIAQSSMNGERVSLKLITKKIDSPEAFTAKILQKLTRANVIESMKGPNGGFEIKRSRLKDIKLSHIVDAIDMDPIYLGCGLGLHECNAQKPCAIHHQYMVVRENLKNMLEQTNLFELATKVEEGATFLKRN